MHKHLHFGYSFCAFLFIFLASNKMLACTGPDVVFTNITVTAINASDYQYSYQIQNIGTTDIAFNQLVIQNYVSADDMYDGGDQPAGGTFIDNTSSGVLAAGATYSGVMGVYAGAYDQSSYPYIIAHVYLSVDTDCDLTNNYFSALIQVSAVKPSSQIADATVNWMTDSKSFIVDNWSGNSSSILQYSVYTTSGTLMLSGNTKEHQSTPINSLSNDLYILYLSDGNKIYSKKIVY